MHHEKYLRMQEVSQMTGVPLGTLRWWRKQANRKNGRQFGPPSAMFGGRVVYRESDVYAWIAAQFTRAAR